MNSKGCLRLVLGVTLVIIVAVFSLSIIGYFWQQSAETSDDEQYPPAGDLYDIDGRTMHLYCEGEGNPTIILDAGLGDGPLILQSYNPS